MTRAKPYTDAEIAERRSNPLCIYVTGRDPYPDPIESRWLATVDALQARLAAAEAECRAREEVQARLIRERNAAEAELDALRAALDAAPEPAQDNGGAASPRVPPDAGRTPASTQVGTASGEPRQHPTQPAQAGEAVYPCSRCGTTRTKAEGGATFTVCDECWDATHPVRSAGAPAPASAEAAFTSDDCPAGDAALGSVWVDRDGAAWRKVSTAPDASGAVQHYHHAAPEPAPITPEHVARCTRCGEPITMMQSQLPDEVGLPCHKNCPAPAQEPVAVVKMVEWDKGYLDALAKNTRPLDGVDEPAQAVVCGDHWHGLSGASVDGSTGCPWCIASSRESERSQAERERDTLREQLQAEQRCVAQMQAAARGDKSEPHDARVDSVRELWDAWARLASVLAARNVMPPSRPGGADAQAGEAVARDAAWIALREFCRMEDIPQDRIQPIDIDRAVAHALRAHRNGGAA